MGKKEIAFLAVLFALAATSLAQTRYVVADSGYPFDAVGLGQNGMIAGSDGQDGYAFDIVDGLIHIPGFDGYDAAAQDVNASGQVVGWSYDATGYSHAFVWDKSGGTRDVANFGHGAQAFGINDLGHVVGRYFVGNDPQAYIWRPGLGWSNLQFVANGISANASRVNNNDEVIGDSVDAQGNDHAALWRPDGTIVDLGNYENYYENIAYGINDSGYICGNDYGFQGYVGYVYDPSGNYTPIYDPYAAGGYVDATGINSRNVVVGVVGDQGQLKGYIWDAQGGITLIDDLLDPSAAGWDIQPYEINDAGQISALGYFNGQPFAVLLIPVQTVAGTIALRNYAASAVAGTLATVDLRTPGSTAALDSHIVALDSGGNFSFTTPLPAGTYDVAVKASHWLRQTQHNVVVGSGGSLSFSLINGDINGDNTISLADFGQLKAAYGSVAGNANWNPNADLDGNGSVGLSDFGILKLNYGMTGDP